MKIELKNIKHYPKLSDETNAFTAEIYVDGIKTAQAENGGYGAETIIHEYQGKSKLLSDVRMYCKTLPKEHSIAYDVDFEQTLDYIIDKLVCEDLLKKDKLKIKKSFEKDMKKGICYGTTIEKYKILYWKNYTLEQLLNFETGKLIIKKALTNLKNENILNTNIPKELYESL